MSEVEQQAQEFRDTFQRLRDEVGKVIVGDTGTIELVLTALFAGGHCLLEGVPGLGKTMLVRTLSEVLDLRFSRIQFTPDLMPADIVGTNIIVEDNTGRREYTFRPGPVFASIVLADEINRATPKTQSALLEAMKEHTVSVGGTVHDLGQPFFVLATQNPIEMEGTYPLPEAQVDRFLFKLVVAYPDRATLTEILNRTTARETATPEVVIDGHNIAKWQDFVRQVPVAPAVMDYAVRIVLATQPSAEEAIDSTKRYVRFGASPRGAQALILAGKVAALRDSRFNVSFEDIQWAAAPALRHRVLMNFEGEAEGVTPDKVIAEILAQLPTKVD